MIYYLLSYIHWIVWFFLNFVSYLRVTMQFLCSIPSPLANPTPSLPPSNRRYTVLWGGTSCMNDAIFKEIFHIYPSSWSFLINMSSSELFLILFLSSHPTWWQFFFKPFRTRKLTPVLNAVSYVCWIVTLYGSSTFTLVAWVQTSVVFLHRLWVWCNSDPSCSSWRVLAYTSRHNKDIKNDKSENSTPWSLITMETIQTNETGIVNNYSS